VTFGIPGEELPRLLLGGYRTGAYWRKMLNFRDQVAGCGILCPDVFRRLCAECITISVSMCRKVFCEMLDEVAD